MAIGMEEEQRMEPMRKKKLAEQQKLAEAKKAEEQLKTTLRVILDEPAYVRLMNVKMASQQVFATAAQYLLRVFQKFRRKITEEELLAVLRTIKERNEKETKITFERK